MFGGTADAVRALIAEARAESAHPLIFAADLERGAGQQFEGATALPPASALASLGDPEVTRRAGFVTGAEAREIGIDWVFAPVADLDIEPRNPIVGTRAFGSVPDLAAKHVAAWIEGCRAAGAATCAKHFPGHGRTVEDSHLAAAVVEQGRVELEADLVPFRAAVAAGVDALMTAHVSYPALDPSGAPATLSRPILKGLLRRELGFTRVIVTDALNMKGLADGAENESAVGALAAGCDLLLYPDDPEAVARSVMAAIETGGLRRSRLNEALHRRQALIASVGSPQAAAGDAGDWSMEIAVRSVRSDRGHPRLGGAVHLIVVDDDVGGPHPAPSRDAFLDELRAAGVPLDPAGAPLILVYSDTRGWKGRAGLSPAAEERVRQLFAAHPDAVWLLFGHPRTLPPDVQPTHLAIAWGGEPLMQRAAVRALASSSS